MTLGRIEGYTRRSGPFVAGLELSPAGIVVRAAPVIGYMHGWTRDQVCTYCGRRGWRIRNVAGRGR